MPRVLPLLLLTACNPWSAVHEREAPWWGPVDALQASAGLELVTLPAGEPVGYWPRVVVGEDYIEVDNRAWFLSLPSEAFEELGEESLRPWLFEERLTVEMTGGVIDNAALRGALISPLYDALLEVAEVSKEAEAQLGAPRFDGSLLILPAPGVPADTLQQVVYTAGQAQLGRATFGGAVDGRVRRVVAAGDSEACAGQLFLRGTETGVTLTSGGRALTHGAACPSGEIGALLERVVSLCAPRWEAAAAPFAEAPGALPPERWRCAALYTHLSGESAAEDLLLALSHAHARYPDVRQSFFYGGAGDTRPCDEPVDLLQPLDAPRLDRLCALPRFMEQLEQRAVQGDRAGLGGLGLEALLGVQPKRATEAPP